MSIREFAAHLGISDRMVSKWEAAGMKIHPRPVNQAALDSSLARSSADVQARFTLIVDSSSTQASNTDSSQAKTLESNRIIHPIDGKPMTSVDAGDFLCGPDGKPAWLPAFYIDVYPTTNSDWARFVVATGYRVPAHWPNGHCPENLLDHPVVFVTWLDATAYAAWAGKCLPSSMQWEKAARGARGNVYPWGNQATPAKCNVRESGVGDTTPIDRYHSGLSPYGAYDMCGNVWEWCSTETELGRHELKGSAFTSSFDRAAPSAFNDAFAKMYDDDTSFRCVIAAEALDELLRRQ
ncbi:MAG: SUMF1/EgtB/PvdO family nonheme iron enzyme [Pseudonocardiaceae bacterium]